VTDVPLSDDGRGDAPDDVDPAQPPVPSSGKKVDVFNDASAIDLDLLASNLEPRHGRNRNG